MDNPVETERRPETVKVAVGIIFDDVRKSVLVARRVGGKEFAGKWEFIGGKVEESETFEEAVKREVSEETLLGVRPLSPLGELKFKADGKNFDVTFFECEVKHGSIAEIDEDSREHSKLEFADLEELKKLDWVGENRRFADWLVAFSKMREPIAGDTYD